MKNFLVPLIFFLASSIVAEAQNIGISNGNFTPDPSAMLDVNSNTKGMLVPRLTSAERDAIASPANGLLIFNRETNSFWYYISGTGWMELAKAADNFWGKNEFFIYNGVQSLPVVIHNGVIATTDGLLNINKRTATASTIETILDIQRGTTGTPANGIGAAISFRNQMATGNYFLSGKISAVADNAANQFSSLLLQSYDGNIVNNSLRLGREGLSLYSPSANVLHEGVLNIAKNFTTTSSIEPVLSIQRQTTGVPAHGMGSSILFRYQRFQNAGITDTSVIISAFNENINTGKTVFQVETFTGSTSSVSIYANSAGVGIAGKTNPAYPLDVNGTVNFTGQLRVNGDAGTSGEVLMSSGNGVVPSWQMVNSNPQVGFMAAKSPNLTVLNTIETPLSGFSKLFDDGNAFNQSTGEYITPSAGVYQFTVHINLSGLGVAVNDFPVQLKVIKNASLYHLKTEILSWIDGYANSFDYTINMKLQQNDYVRFSVVQSSGADLNVSGNGTSSYSFISGVKIY